MGITTMLFYVVARTQWHWTPWKITALTAALLSIDVAFMLGNMVKIPHGGYIPIAIALAVFRSDDDLEDWPQAADSRVAGRCVAVGPLSRRCRATETTSSFGHGRVHDIVQRRRPSRAAAPFEAQQGAA
jgi:KUP system potassium uptake protein